MKVKSLKDLIIKNGRFEKIGNDLASEGETIDAAGLFLFPGIIDDQCHLESRFNRKEV